MKTCNNCKIEKEDFRKCKYNNGKIYYKSICKDCERSKALIYAKNNKEQRKEYQKLYKNKNPEYLKQWKILNKDKIRIKERLKRKNNINYKLKKNISRAISRMIIKDSKSSLRYLPYSIEDLKIHLENQFNNNMSWDNYGSYWHIDHIVPHSLFNYTSMEDKSFKDCWALTNLRPLDARQNMIDGATKVRHKKIFYANNNI